MKSEKEILAEYGGRGGVRGESGAPSRKTVAELNKEHAKRGSGILTGFYDERDRIRDEEKLADSPYLHRLSDEQKHQALQGQKREKVEELRRETVEDYRAEVEDYHAALGSREKELRTELFGGLDAPTLAAAASAGDDALPRILGAAVAAGNGELAKACFVTAEARGLSEVVVPYLESDPGARDLYREWKEIPSREARERQLDTIERVVPEMEPERLMPPACGTT